MERDCFVVIRSIGERTTDYCRSLLPGAEVVGEIPFSATIKKCFQMAIESGCKHLICCDADVVPFRNMVRIMVDQLRQKPEFYAVTGQCKDKLLNRVRTVGVQGYNIKFLRKALQFVDQGTYNIRPEKFIRSKMSDIGIPTFRFKGGPVGRHGYEQYFKDIYRVARIMRKKFWRSGAKQQNRWRKEQKIDPDYKVALAGWEAGENADNLFIDASIDLGIDQVLQKLGLKEKGPL